MAYLAVDKDGTETIFVSKPVKSDDGDMWLPRLNNFCDVEIGTIKELTGKVLTWSDEPVEI